MAKKDKQADQLVNLQAAAQAAQVAQFAAQLEFQKQRFAMLEMPQFQHTSQMDIDRLAYDKANSEWEHAFQEASVTGTYNGVPTLEYLTQMAQMTGVLNGQQTLQGKLTDSQLAQANATIMNMQRGMDLQYQQANTQRQQWDAEHSMALQKQQADLTGYIDGLPTFEREQWQANQATSYLNLLSTLRGPENAFKMLDVIQQTPNGLLGLAQSWAGAFTPQRSAAPALQGLQPATPQNLASSALAAAGQPGAVSGAFAAPAGAPGIAAPPGGPTPAVPMAASTMGGPDGATQAGLATPAVANYQMPGFTIDPAGAQADPNAHNYEATASGGVNVYPPGVAAPATGTQVSSTQPMTASQQQAAVSQATYNPANYVAPGQINARNYNQSYDYEKDVGWAGYEAAGYDKKLAQQIFQRSLPNYGAAAGTTGTVHI